MLLTDPSRSRRTSDLDTVHNYYEHLVFDTIAELLGEQRPDASYVADLACIALNHLPPRYVRHDVDMAFYQSPAEREEMLDKVTQAVQQAIALIAEKTAE